MTQDTTRLAVEGRLEISGPTGEAVLAGNGDMMRMSIENVRTALKLFTLRNQLQHMTGGAPRLGSAAWPPIDVEIHGWRIAQVKSGRTRPTLPSRRPAL